MAKVKPKHKSGKFCYLCGKRDQTALNRPHSLKRTTKVVKPNLQKHWGFEFCQNCFRTLRKNKVDLKLLVEGSLPVVQNSPDK